MKKLQNYDELLVLINHQLGLQGITQTQMASDLKVAQPYLNRILNGKNKPSIEFVFAMADYLQIKLAYSTAV